MQATVVFLCKDIFFWPVLQQAAQANDCQLIIVSQLTGPKIDDLQGTPIQSCIIDLSAVELAQLESQLAAFRTMFTECKIVAFGSHVHRDRLKAAADMKCDIVLTRGELSAQINQLLPQWIA